VGREQTHDSHDSFTHLVIIPSVKCRSRYCLPKYRLWYHVLAWKFSD